MDPETSLNGERKRWSAAEIMDERQNGAQKVALRRGILALCQKMVLLPAPISVSSSEIRGMLAANQDVSEKVGLANAAFLTERRIGLRTKGEVKAMLESGQLLGGRRRRAKQRYTRRSVKQKRFKKVRTKKNRTAK